MIVKELIEKLLEYDMQSNVSLGPTTEWDEDITAKTVDGNVLLLRGKEEAEEVNTSEKEELIKDTLDSINFENIHKYMELINHTWYFPDGKYRVPTDKELEEQATNLLSHTYDFFKSTGKNQNDDAYGFEAFVGNDDEGDLEMTLKFVIEDGYGYKIKMD